MLIAHGDAFAMVMNSRSEELVGRMDLATCKPTNDTHLAYVKEETSVLHNTQSKFAF